MLKDRDTLNRELVRLHVVANSDSEADQNIKLQVRDAVLRSLEENLAKVSDVEEAKEFIQENLPRIQNVAKDALAAAGCDYDVVVSLCKEAFDRRCYDTFSLPAGVYEALRITIGNGNGKNWWCVVFPSLCLPATSEGFEKTAECAGFSDSLNQTLMEAEGYKLRFYLLDLLGRFENTRFEG